MEPISTEQWRWQATEKLDNIEAKVDHLHQCFERRMLQLDTRITPLERFRSYMVGAAYTLVLVAPLLWWFVSTKLLPVLEKTGK